MPTLPPVPDTGTTAVSLRFYPRRAVVVGRALLTGEPLYRGPGIPVRVLEQLGSTRPGAVLRFLVQAEEGYAWINASDLKENRS